ncbi:MAG: N-acetylglutamate synthase [Actinomycetota bacterium]|nr:N-acetylglutamate synthase [Actinomycetota bacterium]
MSEADEASRALGDMLGLMALTCPGGWAERREGASASACRTIAAPMNRAIAELPSADAADVAALVERLADLPHIVETRPGADAVEDWCRSRGMTATPGVPLMTCSATAVTMPPYDEATALRSLTDMAEHVDVAAPSYDRPRDWLAALDGSTLFDQDFGAGLVADVDGEPAATGISIVAGEWVGVFIIGTVPAYRRRGLGAALTAKLVVDAVARNGVTRALLQSSAMGRGVYASLGFATVDEWTRWTPATP